MENWMLQKLESLSIKKWFQYAVIIGVFILSIFISLRPNSRLTLLIPIAVIAAFALIILLRNISLGFWGIVIACFLIPNILSSGGLGNTLSSPNLLLVAILGIWIFDLVVKRRKIEFAHSKTTLPAFVLLIVALVAFLNGQINYYSFAQLAPISAQIGGLAIFLLSIGAFLAMANLIDNDKSIKIFTWLYVTIGTVYILGRLISQYNVNILSFFQYGSDSSLFWIWLTAICSSQALFNRQLNIRWRWILISILIVTFFVALNQAYSWKSGWLPSIIAVFVIIWVGFPKARIPGLIVAGSALFLYLFGDLGGIVSGGEDYSIMTRNVAWKLVLEIAKANPILGLGMANYYWYSPLFPILGYSVNYNSHNNYIDIIAQTGIVGLAVFIWLIISIGRVGWSLVDKVPVGFPRAYVIGALGGLAGMVVAGMLGDWILPFVYNVGMPGLRASLIGWLFLGGLVAIEQILLKSTSDIPLVINKKH